MSLLVASGGAAAFLLALTLLLDLGLLWRVLGAVAVGLGISAALIPAARHWVPHGVAAGFFGVVLYELWELLVVARDALHSAAIRGTRPRTSSGR